MCMDKSKASDIVFSYYKSHPDRLGKEMPIEFHRDVFMAFEAQLVDFDAYIHTQTCVHYACAQNAAVRVLWKGRRWKAV